MHCSSPVKSWRRILSPSAVRAQCVSPSVSAAKALSPHTAVIHSFRKLSVTLRVPDSASVILTWLPSRQMLEERKVGRVYFQKGKCSVNFSEVHFSTKLLGLEAVKYKVWCVSFDISMGNDFKCTWQGNFFLVWGSLVHHVSTHFWNG